jgi:hypothetical protein
MRGGAQRCQWWVELWMVCASCMLASVAPAIGALTNLLATTAIMQGPNPRAQRGLT